MGSNMPREVIINGDRAVTVAETLAQLLAELDLVHARIATAVNGRFVPELERAGWPLAAGDRIEIVSPRQGG